MTDIALFVLIKSRGRGGGLLFGTYIHHNVTVKAGADSCAQEEADREQEHKDCFESGH